MLELRHLGLVACLGWRRRERICNRRRAWIEVPTAPVRPALHNIAAGVRSGDISA
jgi:hypothetical protein